MEGKSRRPLSFNSLLQPRASDYKLPPGRAFQAAPLPRSRKVLGSTPALVCRASCVPWPRVSSHSGTGIGDDCNHTIREATSIFTHDEC